MVTILAEVLTVIRAAIYALASHDRAALRSAHNACAQEVISYPFALTRADSADLLAAQHVHTPQALTETVRLPPCWC